jgi:prepilin-type N-terminal cleavage/methylation domain-containing protein
MGWFRRSKPRGFSLAELGIVLAVVAVLSTVILMGRGYVLAAKVNVARDLVSSVVAASRQYAKREHEGLGFGVVGTTTAASMTTLRGANLLPPNVRTPWKTESDMGDIGIEVAPESGVDSRCASAPGVGAACVKVCMVVPDQDTCDNLKTQFGTSVLSVSCAQAGCGLTADAVLLVVTR